MFSREPVTRIKSSSEGGACLGIVDASEAECRSFVTDYMVLCEMDEPYNDLCYDYDYCLKKLEKKPRKILALAIGNAGPPESEQNVPYDPALYVSLLDESLPPKEEDLPVMPPPVRIDPDLAGRVARNLRKLAVENKKRGRQRKKPPVNKPPADVEVVKAPDPTPSKIETQHEAAPLETAPPGDTIKEVKLAPATETVAEEDRAETVSEKGKTRGSSFFRPYFNFGVNRFGLTSGLDYVDSLSYHDYELGADFLFNISGGESTDWYAGFGLGLFIGTGGALVEKGYSGDFTEEIDSSFCTFGFSLRAYLPGPQFKMDGLWEGLALGVFPYIGTKLSVYSNSKPDDELDPLDRNEVSLGVQLALNLTKNFGIAANFDYNFASNGQHGGNIGLGVYMTFAVG